MLVLNILPPIAEPRNSDILDPHEKPLPGLSGSLFLEIHLLIISNSQLLR